MKRLLASALLSILTIGLLALPFQTDAAVRVKGYFRKDGTYLQPHYRSNPDGNPYNNWSFPGNVNPYTGKVAPGNPDTYLKNYNNNSSPTPSPSQSTYTSPPLSPNPSTSASITGRRFSLDAYLFGTKYDPSLDEVIVDDKFIPASLITTDGSKLIFEVPGAIAAGSHRVLIRKFEAPQGYSPDAYIGTIQVSEQTSAVTPIPDTQASEIASLQKQINALLQQIAQLQKQIADSQKQSKN
jgi:hypothetical protein